jgi:cyclophilin family peptidyl-prolyl cis-trans isomerase
MNRVSLVGLLLILGVVFGACGGIGEDGDDDSETAVPTVGAPLDEDIASGCWTAEQRGLPLEVEDHTVAQWTSPPAMAIDTKNTYVATIETDQGSFDITFFASEAPNTVNNFVCLARAGFYNNTTFHRIVSGFVIQGGDPEGTGRGGPGYRFNDEPVSRSYSRGIVAMANAGPNTNGSQFFVCLQNVGLPPNYTIFGEVTKGMDVVDKIAAVPTKVGSGGEKSTPVEPVNVSTVVITETAP